MTGTVARIGVYSFNGNKIISSGGGGMLVTHDAAIAEKAAYLTTQAKDDPVRYIHDEIGFNYRLTNVQAALGVAQLELLPAYLARKQEIYETYRSLLEPIRGLRLAATPAYGQSNYWLMCLQIDNHTYGMDREAVMTMLGKHKVQSRPVWMLNHLQKPYKEFQAFCIERALEVSQDTLNIPGSVNLSKDDILRVVEVLKR